MSRSKIPFLELRPAYLELRDEIDAVVARVLDSGWYLLGAELEAFESEFAAYVGAKHCVGCGNGLDAMHLTLRAMGIGQGDEVIVPSNTYVATWLAVTYAGATPIPVEPDEATYNLAPERVEAALTPRTRAILPVHLYGQPADMDPLVAITRRRGLRVLDDCAQAHGARYRERMVGNLADASAWSFYPTKNLGAIGDGGAVTTDDDDLAESLRVLRNYGQRTRYVNDVLGVNSRLDEIQAAVLRVKLRHLDAWNGRRRATAHAYLDGLAGLDLGLPQVPNWADPAWHLFVVRTPRRDAVQTALRDRGIGTIVHYPVPPHLQEAYRHLALRPGDLPIAEAIHREVLSLPIGPQQTAAETRTVIEAVRSALA